MARFSIRCIDEYLIAWFWEIGREMSAEILEKVKGIVSEQLEKDAADISPESNFANDLGADSLDVVELVMALEEEFDIEIPDEAAEKIATVQAAVDYIAEQTTAKA